MNSHPDVPVSITSARLSHSEDIRRRQMRYLLSMAIRTVCFILAIVTTGPLRWTLVAGAVFLPYVAVVLANATDRRTSSGPPEFQHDDKPQIEGPRTKAVVIPDDDRAGDRADDR